MQQSQTIEKNAYPVCALVSGSPRHHYEPKTTIPSEGELFAAVSGKMEIGSKRAELGIRDMVGWQNGRNAILTGTGKRMVPNTGPEEERRKEVVKEEIKYADQSEKSHSY